MKIKLLACVKRTKKVFDVAFEVPKRMGIFCIHQQDYATGKISLFIKILLHNSWRNLPYFESENHICIFAHVLKLCSPSLLRELMLLVNMLLNLLDLFLKYMKIVLAISIFTLENCILQFSCISKKIKEF
jgi:hypothetical protein